MKRRGFSFFLKKGLVSLPVIKSYKIILQIKLIDYFLYDETGLDMIARKSSLFSLNIAETEKPGTRVLIFIDVKPGILIYTK